jgi:excisionase family DNA binding protein
MTVKETAAYLRCDPSTVYRLLRLRKIPALKIGSDWRFHLGELERWMAAQALKSTSP